MEKQGFIGRDEWSRKLPETSFKDNIYTLYGDNQNVSVLRNINFFYVGQKTTLDKVSEFFTIKAIINMVHDKFIEIN